MSKVAIFDPYLRKFSAGIENWWLSQGHVVRMDRYYNPELVLWADIIWFETCDNNLASATNPSQAILDDTNNFQPWDMHNMDMTDKRVIVRPIDIEVWQGHQNASIWDIVDDVIFIAPHIQDIANIDELPGRTEKLRTHVVRCGVDLGKWSFAEREPGFEIAVVAERWASKGTSEILQIAMKLKDINPNYKITWLGRRSDYQWEHAYRDEFVEQHRLNIEFINEVDNVDVFLEDKNYLLSCSHKEAFGYNIAEAMAKGIKPIVHRFYGADALWPGMTWDTIDQAIAMITSDDYDSVAYRQYLITHEYTLPQMMASIDKIVFNEGEK